MSRLQSIQAWLRKRLSGVLGDTLATLIANQIVAIISGVGFLGILFFLLSQVQRVWQEVSSILELRLSLFHVLLILLSSCIVILILSRLKKRANRQPRETRYFFYKAYGCNWKARKTTGEIADLSVYCPLCQTELTETEYRSSYVCLNCGTKVEQSYWHLDELRTEVEKLTTRIVRGKLPQI